jgi:SAM-dependent methyltransferase
VSQPSAHARQQYAATTGNLTARIALHRYGTDPQSWWEWLTPRLPRTGPVLEVGAGTLYHVDDPAVVLHEFARVLKPGGRVAIAVNGHDHMAELDLFGDRPTGRLNGFSAESGPAALAAIFTDVTAERYPGDLAVPSVEPVLAYLDSWTPLSAADRAAAAAQVQARIDADGFFSVRKHTVLLAGRRR